jgi:hypothetical protein
VVHKAAVRKFAPVGFWAGGYTTKGVNGGSYTVPLQYLYDCYAGLYDGPNPPVFYGSIDATILRDTCRRVSEQRAREIHPALFVRIDD